MRYLKLFEQFDSSDQCSNPWDEEYVWVQKNIKGLVINSVKEDDDYTSLKLNTNKGILCFAPGGGAIVSYEGDTNLNNVTIIDVTDVDEYGLTLVFDNGNTLTIYDDTGGEGLEIWWDK